MSQSSPPAEQKLEVHVVPNARRSEVAGDYGGRLKIRIAAPAVDDKANRELVRFLSEKLAIPKGAISILRGEKSRDKTLAIRTANNQLPLDALHPVLEK
jgi:uncharacterized protein (TIGR00251 family)